MSLFLIELDGRQVLFSHVPKTGGTSIRQNRTVAGVEMTDPPESWQWEASVGVVREPAQRLASAYRDFRFLRKMHELSMADWLREMVKATEPEIAAPNTMQHHAAPMTHPVHGLQHVDTVLDFSRLQEQWDAWCEEHDFVRRALPQLRRSRGEVPEMPMTTECLELIEEHYEADYELWTSVVGR